jgi:thiol-disulfide isomerase/thioredoxin
MFHRTTAGVAFGLTLSLALGWCAGSGNAEPPAGSWKLSIPGSNLTFLLSLESSEGKWTGKLLGTSLANFPTSTLSDVAVTADSLRFLLKFGGGGAGQTLNFEGKLPPDTSGRIGGSLLIGPNSLILVRLEPSKLKSFDRFELAKETLEQTSDAQVLAEAAIELIKEAGERKANVDDVRGWADKAFRSAEAYGLRWQRSIARRLAQAMMRQKELAPVAVEYARKLERLVDDNDDLAVQLDFLTTVAEVFEAAGRSDDAKDLRKRLAELEEKDLEAYLKSAPFRPEPFEGRKGKSDRVVLVELFTGAECPPCVAADLAFDALSKTYKPTEVVLLQYHLHIPGPDPLTNPDSLARLEYYGNKIRGTPTIFFNGKPGQGGGGPITQARRSYASFRETIDPLLEKLPDAKIELGATQRGSVIDIKAKVSELARTGDSIRLRFALVEEHVRYQGGNSLRYHHQVVRFMPGGPKGFALKQKSGEYTAQVDLDQLRNRLTEYLDEFAKEEEFPRPDRPMNLKSLKVAAFVQDDDTNEVLQAALIDVKD